MPINDKRVILVTGASSGIGKACAELLHAQGHRVYGTSRKEAPAATFAMLRMDVSDGASIARGVASIIDTEGRIDVVVNNAGVCIAGAVEDTSIEEAKALFECNVFGVLRVCQAVLPAMRARRAGCIINMSSIAGVVAIPFQGVYGASKFALEGLTESMRMEVQPFGVDVVLIEPGDTKTGMTDRGGNTRASQNNQAYRDLHRATLEVVHQDEAHAPSPEVVARVVARIVNAPKPGLRYRVGPVVEKLAITLRNTLPQAWFEWGLMKYYKLH